MSQHSLDAKLPTSVMDVTDAVHEGVYGPVAGTICVGAAVVTPPTGMAIENVKVDSDRVPVTGPV
jgi:hypothetical protein